MQLRILENVVFCCVFRIITAKPLHYKLDPASLRTIDREFEFYEFFSFLKFNEFYEFFSVEKTFIYNAFIRTTDHCKVQTVPTIPLEGHAHSGI